MAIHVAVISIGYRIQKEYNRKGFFLMYDMSMAVGTEVILYLRSRTY